MGRPCRCCKPAISKLPDTPYGRCPCTPWEISSNFNEPDPYGLGDDDHCMQNWLCLNDDKENGDQEFIDGCYDSYKHGQINYHKYWSPDTCDISGELQEYAGYVKFPPATWCIKNPDDPSSLNEPDCGQTSVIISKIIHIGSPATIDVGLHADAPAGECETTDKSDAVSYEAEPGWYEIAYSYTEYTKVVRKWVCWDIFDANGEKQGEDCAWHEMDDDHVTKVHAAYVRKFVDIVYDDPDKERPANDENGNPIGYPDGPTGTKHYWDRGVANPADKEPAADGIGCCGSYRCFKTDNQEKGELGLLYGTSPLNGWAGLDDNYKVRTKPLLAPFEVEMAALPFDFGGDGKESWEVPHIYVSSSTMTKGAVTRETACTRLETFSAIAHFEGGSSAESSIAAFEFTFTRSGEPDIWPEGSEEHKKALDVLDEDIIQKGNCEARFPEGIEENIDRYWGGEWDCEDPLLMRGCISEGVKKWRKLQELGCLCPSMVWDANGTVMDVDCAYKGCQSLTLKDVRTLWEYNPDKARKALCPEPSNEVIDCEQQFAEIAPFQDVEGGATDEGTGQSTGEAGDFSRGIKTHSFNGEWRMDWPLPYDAGLTDKEFEWEDEQCREYGYKGYLRGAPSCGRGAWSFCHEGGGCY